MEPRLGGGTVNIDDKRAEYVAGLFNSIRSAALKADKKFRDDLPPADRMLGMDIALAHVILAKYISKDNNKDEVVDAIKDLIDNVANDILSHNTVEVEITVVVGHD